jgi:RNA polymerase sigma-70 factor (ECF subfamily)
VDERIPQDDAEVVERVRAGDTEAYAALVRRYHPKVYQLCYGMLGAADRADDAAQEAFIKAFTRLSQFRGESAFSTWLYRLTSNHCLDVLRARTRHKTDSWDQLLETQGERIEALLQAPTPPEGISDELKETIHTLLAELKPEYRAILTLREMQGLTYEEMARVLDTSLDSVKARLKRARQQLGEKLRHVLGASFV